MRLLLALLALSLPVCFAETKTSSPAPAPALPKPTPAKDAATVRFEKFELKDTKLINVLQVIRAMAYHQGQLIDIELNDLADGSLGERTISISLTNTTVGQLMLMLSRIADFKCAIKGNVVTVDPK